MWLSKKSLCPKLDGQVVLGAALLRAVSLSMSLGRCPQELLEELLGWYTSLYAIVLHAGLRCLARYVNVYCPPGHDQVCFEAIANFWASYKIDSHDWVMVRDFKCTPDDNHMVPALL